MDTRNYSSNDRPSRRTVSARDDAGQRDRDSYRQNRRASGSSRSYADRGDYSSERGSRYADGRRSDQTRNGRDSRTTRQASRSAENTRSYDRPSRSSSSSRAERSARNSREIYAGPSPSAWQKAMDMLPDNVWINRIIFAVAALLLIFILFNLVTCIGGAFAPKTDAQQSENASAESANSSAQAEQASASASASAASYGVESPWTDDGRFSTGDSALDAYVKKLCDEHSTEGATFDKNAYDTYIFVSRTSYVERENNQSPWGPTWDVEYAKQYFDEGNSGNCYNYVAVTEYILKYFGYSDAEAEPCVVKLQSGAWGDHGLVFVTNKVDGKRCLVDDALSADGWMLDINAYDYDVRNINQNSTIKGNVDALDDDNNPTRIQPGELTQTSTASQNPNGTNEDGTNGTQQETTTDTETVDDEYNESEYVDDTTEDANENQNQNQTNETTI